MSLEGLRFSRPLFSPMAVFLENLKRVIVTPAVYPRLVEFLHFDIQSTGQKSHCVNTTFWPSQCYVLIRPRSNRLVYVSIGWLAIGKLTVRFPLSVPVLSWLLTARRTAEACQGHQTPGAGSPRPVARLVATYSRDVRPRPNVPNP